MFKKYNSTQKLVVIFALLVFILGNFLAFVLALNYLSSSSQEGDVISAKINVFGLVEDRSFKFNELINIEDGLIEIKTPNAHLLATAPIEFKFEGIDKLEILSGSALILPSSTLRIGINRGSLTLISGGKYIYDSKEETLLVLGGKLNLRGKEVLPNSLVVWEVDNFNTYNFNRQDLTNKEVYRDLTLVSSSFNVDVLELTDVIPPRLISISPSDNFTTTDSNIRITGKTEKDSLVLINNKEVEIDNLGNFSFGYNLTSGYNIVNITLLDQYGNKSIIVLNYLKT